MSRSTPRQRSSTLSPEERRTWAQSYKNWDWINAHPEILEPYGGQYVAIYEQRVVASGADHRAFRAALNASPYRDETVLMIRVPRQDEVDGLLVL
jgi:hypothetical protein